MRAGRTGRSRVKLGRNFLWVWKQISSDPPGRSTGSRWRGMRWGFMLQRRILWCFRALQHGRGQSVLVAALSKAMWRSHRGGTEVLLPLFGFKKT